MPEGFATTPSYLDHLTWEGARERWGEQLPATVVERLAYELQVIKNMGFASYFLIVWDLIKHAKDHGIRVGPGRGSAAGCAVAYCLRITDLDPIKYDLLFERFLNPSRISMPDIDMDFDSRYRDEMIRYAAEKYGRDHVAQIITFGTIKARERGARRRPRARLPVRRRRQDRQGDAAAGDGPRHAAQVLLRGEPEVRRRLQGGRPSCGRCTTPTPTSSRSSTSPRVSKACKRSDGIHAAAVVITKDPLTTYLPVQRKPEAGGDPEDAPVVTQYEMHGVEELGLLKMDFLGLRNLDVITDTVAMVRGRQGPGVRHRHRAARRPAGVRPAQPRRLDGRVPAGVAADARPACARWPRPASRTSPPLIALYRPGPMSVNMHYDYADRKNGRKPVELFHADAERGARRHLRPDDLSGERDARRPEVRRLLAGRGRQPPQGDGQEDPRGDGHGARGVRGRLRAHRLRRRRSASSCSTSSRRFADYAFNKSHTFGYGLVTYQTAYLKAHYPVEYFACLLTSVKSNLDKAAVYLADCRAMGIKVLDARRQPLGHRLRRASTPSDVPIGVELPPGSPGAITFGLSAVRNVGEGLVELLLAERDANGPFDSLPRLRRAGARAGAQQAHGRVADQGRRVRLRSAIRARAC